MSKYRYNVHFKDEEKCRMFKELFLEKIEKEFQRKSIKIQVKDNVIKFNRIQFNPSKNYYKELFNFIDEGEIIISVSNNEVKINVLHKLSKLIFSSIVFSLILGGFFWVRSELSTIAGIILLITLALIFYIVGYFLIENGFRKMITKCVNSSKAKVKFS